MVEMSKRPRRLNPWVSNKELHLLVLVFGLLPFFCGVLVFIFNLVCCRTHETVGSARSCSANYLVELLQLLVGANLRPSSHRPFTRSALTVRSISASHSSICLFPQRLRISGQSCVSQIFLSKSHTE
jgi:hypothetical protein